MVNPWKDHSGENFSFGSRLLDSVGANSSTERVEHLVLHISQHILWKVILRLSQNNIEFDTFGVRKLRRIRLVRDEVPHFCTESTTVIHFYS